MTKIKIPNSKRKKALLIVDVQKDFVGKDKKLVSNIVTLLSTEKYDLYVDITFDAEKGSLWDRQSGWTFPYEPTVPEVENMLVGKKVLKIIKETKSAFKGDKDLFRILKKEGIEEVHIIGLDTSDCVFATANEAFDLGLYTYVIEECTASSEGKKLYNSAINILRSLYMTNHSVLKK